MGPLADQRVIVGTAADGFVTAGPQQAVLVLGPPRAGKTSTLVVPNVLAAWGPVLTTSTKTDVLAATAAARGRRGRCWLYDPSGTVPVPPGLIQLRWSPVTGAATWDGALLLARAMVGAARPGRGLLDGDHWSERAEALLAPLLHAAAVGGDDLATLVAWVNRRTGAPAAARLAGCGAPADLLAGLLETDERELSGIWSTASGVLAAYRSDGAVASATEPNFDARLFVASSYTVYVCGSARHQEFVAPLVVGLIEDVRAAAFERSVLRSAGADRAQGVWTGSRAGSEPPGVWAGSEPPGVWAGSEPPLLLALDEVANVAPLPALPALVSEGGGQGVLVLACLQDLSQARRRGGIEAEGFGSLFGATVVLPGIGDVRTLEALSVLCGAEDVWVRSESGRQRTWSTRRQPRLAPDEVARGRPGHGLLVGGGRVPTLTPLPPWWRVWGRDRPAPGWSLPTADPPAPGWSLPTADPPAPGWVRPTGGPTPPRRPGVSRGRFM